ncbi:MAG: phage tail sheath family protein, partial [Alcanivoracaceae bacterium]|nr:phage tail sheath family protein [Alcanivoracaceae bacterium]
SALNDGNAIAKEIQHQVNNAFPNILSFSGFTCTYDTDTVNSDKTFFKLTSGGSDVLESTIELAEIIPSSPPPNLVLTNLLLDTAAAATLKLGRTIQQGIDKVIPISLAGTDPVAESGETLTGGQDTQPIATDFTTFYNTTLRKFRDISILVVPGSSWNGGLGQANLSASLAHCEFMKNRVLILDPPAGKELDNAVDVRALGLPTSTYSVLYYPWVSMNNPLYHPDKNPLVSKKVNVAPSAIAAGMWAKIDGKRGVWKAPAGVKTQIIGALDLEFIVEDLEQDQLNPLGINSIRKIPNFGSVFWGARTLATKSDPEWRYVPVRRTAIFIEQSIYNGIQWAVFEPNTHLLWSSLRANIGSFMNGLFRSGAFQGEKANDAYFVRCGLDDTMTQGDIDLGRVIVIVGFAPIKPAEFVIVRIQQKVGEV